MRTLFPLAVAFLVLFALPGAIAFAADVLGYGTEINAWLEGRLGISHRLALSLPAASVLFAVPPLIVILYFLRLRRKPVLVSSTFLWHKSIEDLHVNRLMQWLRRNILLLLQLLAIFLLLYAVLGPRLHGTSTVDGRHYILILDNSASMSATDVPPNRLAWAKAEAIKEIEAATDADFGMVIVFDRTAEIRQSYTSNRALLRAAVEGVQPTVFQTRIDEALNLAASLANPARSTENEVSRPDNPEPGKDRTYVAAEGMSADVHLYSDGVFPPVPGFALEHLNLTYHTPPAPSENGASNNIAIIRLDASRDPDDNSKLIVTATVRNYRETPVDKQTVRLEVLDPSGRVINSYSRNETLPAKTPTNATTVEAPFTLTDVPENSYVIFRVRLEKTADALAVDDEAWLVPGVARKARVLVIGRDNAVLRKFLDAPSTKAIADVTRYGPEALADREKYLDPARDGKFDLVIFDRCGPANEDEMPRANTFFIGFPPPPFHRPVPGQADDTHTVKPVTNPAITGWSDGHPAMRYLRGLYDIEIDEAFRFPELPPKTGRLLESDGNLTLLAAIPRQSFTDLVLAFPIVSDDGRWNTLWPLRPSFVMFLRNIVRSLGHVRDALATDELRPGDVKVLRPTSGSRVTITWPNGTRTETLLRGSRADVSFTGTDAVGVYTATWDDDGIRFAVNLFDPEESDIAPRAAVTIGNQSVAAGQERKEPRSLWKLAVLGGLIVLLGEWWVYNRRVQI